MVIVGRKKYFRFSSQDLLMNTHHVAATFWPWVASQSEICQFLIPGTVRTVRTVRTACTAIRYWSMRTVPLSCLTCCQLPCLALQNINICLMFAPISSMVLGKPCLRHHHMVQ